MSSTGYYNNKGEFVFGINPKAQKQAAAIKRAREEFEQFNELDNNDDKDIDLEKNLNMIGNIDKGGLDPSLGLDPALGGGKKQKPNDSTKTAQSSNSKPFISEDDFFAQFDAGIIGKDKKDSNNDLNDDDDDQIDDNFDLDDLLNDNKKGLTVDDAFASLMAEENQAAAIKASTQKYKTQGQELRERHFGSAEEVIHRVLNLARSKFEIFQVAPSEVTLKELNKWYRKLSLILHPDKCSHPDAGTAFDKVKKAFEELKKDCEDNVLQSRYADIWDMIREKVRKEREEENNRRAEIREELEKGNSISSILNANKSLIKEKKKDKDKPKQNFGFDPYGEKARLYAEMRAAKELGKQEVLKEKEKMKEREKEEKMKAANDDGTNIESNENKEEGNKEEDDDPDAVPEALKPEDLEDLPLDGPDFEKAVISACEDKLENKEQKEKEVKGATLDEQSTIMKANMDRIKKREQEDEKERKKKIAFEKKWKSQSQMDKRVAGWQIFQKNVKTGDFKSQAFGKIGQYGAGDRYHKREEKNEQQMEAEREQQAKGGGAAGSSGLAQRLERREDAEWKQTWR